MLLLGSFSPPVRAEDLDFPVSFHLEINGFLKIYFSPFIGIAPSRP